MFVFGGRDETWKFGAPFLVNLDTFECLILDTISYEYFGPTADLIEKVLYLFAGEDSTG